MNIHHLRISWATSRGRDTYGYNICRLDDSISDKRYRTCGGGYDLVGTVVAHWLKENYQGQLQALFKREAAKLLPYASTGWMQHPDLYGAYLKADGTVSLDGACGLSSMWRVAEAIGLKYQREGNRKGHTIGYFVSAEGETK